MGSVVTGFCIKCGAVASLVGGASRETLLCNSCENFYRNSLRDAVLEEQAAATEEAAAKAKEKNAEKLPSWLETSLHYGLPGSLRDEEYASTYLKGVSNPKTLQMRPEKIDELTLGIDAVYGETLTINGHRYLLSEEVRSWLRAAVR